MDHNNKKHILFHIQKLFPRQEVTDAVEVFLFQRVKYHSVKRGDVRWFEFGNKVAARKVTKSPNGEIKEYSGKEICEKIINYLNNEYWLITLWDLLYEDSVDSLVSREIVRAFIKHCISTIAHNLVVFGPKIITCSNINNNCLPNNTLFYKTVFSYSGIINEMRSRIRSRLKIYPNKNIEIDHNIKINTDKLMEIFDKDGQSKYSDLIRAIESQNTPKDSRYQVNDLIGIFNFANRFSPGKSNITKEIKRLSKGM